jgi:hypothetical protein
MSTKGEEQEENVRCLVATDMQKSPEPEQVCASFSKARIAVKTEIHWAVG